MRGSLKDIGIGELIQFPALSGKSGCIELTQEGRRAGLYYVSGELHHAELAETTGLPVLVEILSWRTGTWTFSVGTPCPARTIDMDLGKAILQATLQQTEAPPADAPDVQSTAGFQSVFGPAWDPSIFARISTFLADHPLFFYASVLSRSGRVRAEFVRPAQDLPVTAETLTLLRDILKNYALLCDQPMVVDSSYCLVALQPYDAENVLVALARPSATEPDVRSAIDALVVKLDDPFQLSSHERD